MTQTIVIKIEIQVPDGATLQVGSGNAVQPSAVMPLAEEGARPSRNKTSRPAANSEKKEDGRKTKNPLMLKWIRENPEENTKKWRSARNKAYYWISKKGQLPPEGDGRKKKESGARHALLDDAEEKKRRKIAAQGYDPNKPLSPNLSPEFHDATEKE